MARRPPRTHYQLLGVAPDCSLDELRTAYRRLARLHHPDVADTAAVAGTAMSDLNEAWRVLSDERLRRDYDAAVLVPDLGRAPSPARAPGWAPRRPSGASRFGSGAPTGVDGRRPATGTRRQAWAAGVQAQMARLARQAGRSATQTMLIRAPRASRAGYEAVVDRLVTELIQDAESRIRAARAAGAAPLDLGVAATLVGIRVVADRMRRTAPLGVSTETLMAAELLDRMWDVLAHELPSQLTAALGGNPQVARAIVGGR